MKISIKDMNVAIIFTHEKDCWKLIIDVPEVSLEEILECIKQQYLA